MPRSSNQEAAFGSGQCNNLGEEKKRKNGAGLGLPRLRRREGGGAGRGEGGIGVSFPSPVLLAGQEDRLEGAWAKGLRP